jgi:putative phage-type endonuclease
MGLTPKQLIERRKGIGGSDAAAVCGLSPWKTPIDVYYEKIADGLPEDNETPAMRRGTILEPAIRQMYAEETGRSVVTLTEPVVHSSLRFVRANLDGLASNDIVLECKTARTKNGWGEPGSSDIPVAYLCQVQHNMLAARKHRCDVAVLFGDFEFAIYPIEADPAFQGLLMDEEMAFWKCVVRREPPDPITGADIEKRWPRSVVQSVAATSADIDAAVTLSQMRAAIKELECCEEQAATILKASIKDAEGLSVDGDLLCTWKSVAGNPQFDVKRFRERCPKLYDRYLVAPAPQRRLLLKEKCPCLQIADHSQLQSNLSNLLRRETPS